MLSDSQGPSLQAVVQAANAFTKQATSIDESVQNWAQATFSKDFFIHSLGDLAVKVADIGQRASRCSVVDETDSAQLRRLCSQVQADLATLYTQVVQNAQIKNRADETFFLDHLSHLEKIWSDGKAPLYASYTQTHDPITPKQVEALDHTTFLQALGEYSGTFAGHPVSCFVSYAEVDGPAFASMVCNHLKKAGITAQTQDDLGPKIGRDRSRVDEAIQAADYVIVLGSKAYGERDDCDMVMAKPKKRRLRALVGGTVLRSFPAGMNHARTGYADFRLVVDYHSQVLDLLKRLYAQANRPFPLFTPTVQRADPIQNLLRTAYAQKPDIRRFMGDEVPFESVYVAPDICSTLLDATRQHVWITGEPGSGKSTLCHYIAYLYGTLQGQELEQRLGSWAKDCSGVIWIPLRDLLLYEKNDISLEQLVADLRFDGEVIDGLKTWLQSPGLVFLLDSEEEVHHLRDERSQRGRLLKQLLNKPCSIITSRSDERSPKTTRVVVLPPFDRSSVELFVNRYFTDAEKPDQASLFLDSVPNSVRELMHVPLTLELLCYRWSKVEHHATAPILLYQGILADLCRLKAKNKNIDLSTLTNDEVEKEFSALPYLFEIALQAKKQEKGEFIGSALYAPILEQVEKSKRLLIYEQLFADETFVRRVGRPSHYSNQTYVFHHAVFMDYCAARHLALLRVANGDDLESLIAEWTTLKSFPYWLQTILLSEALHLAIDPMRSPLHRAAAIGNLKEMKLLLDEGAWVDQTTKNGLTPLHVAVLSGQVEVVKLLLERGTLIGQTAETGMTPLHVAAISGHVEVVKLLLDRGASIDPTEENGTTPLHRAAQAGQVEVAKLLLDRGASIDQTTKSGETPLHWAAALGQVELAKLLLDRRASIDQTTENGRTPLHQAAYAGHVEAAKLFLEKGASTDRTTEGGMTPLHTAAAVGQTEVVKLLLGRGALVNQTKGNGGTPLHLAAAEGQVEVTQLLLDRGASIDQAMKSGMTPLHLAAFSGQVEVARLLIKRGASINQTTKNGWTPLHLAAAVGQIEVVRLLLDRGASIDQTTKNGETPLHLAATLEQVEVVKLLLDRGASMESEEENGATPLHLAATAGHVEVVKLLLDRGASTDRTTEGGVTPLHLAAFSGQVEVARLLIKRGASINQTTKNGWTPLHWAAAEGQVEVTKLLLDRGASTDRTTEGGGTPLRSAAISGHVEVARLLLDRGALIDQTDKNGMAPLHEAAFGGHVEVVALLLERGASIESKEKDGATPLHAAAISGQVEVAELLLDNKASIDQVAENGRTPLHLAANTGQVEVVKLLLDRGALIDQTTKNGKTPLHAAAAMGHVEVVTLLLDGGASIDQTEKNGRTALDLARDEGKSEIVSLLIESAEQKENASAG